MSTAESRPLRLLCFGDAAGEVWGGAVSAGTAALAFGTPDGTGSAIGSAELSIGHDDDGWLLTGQDFELRFSPVGQDGATEPSAAGDELCHVEGRLSVAGHERAVSCPGTVSIEPETRIGPLDSVRALSGWFGADHGLTLHALRPAGSKGHEQDAIAATLFDPEEWVAVTDPRLSTTFKPSELPARASLELWVGDGEELHPRRAAAEAAGQAAEAGGEGLRLAITPLLCHSAGHDGTGVYLIAHL
jgi:hypothetical protein